MDRVDIPETAVYQGTHLHVRSLPTAHDPVPRTVSTYSAMSLTALNLDHLGSG